jgi:hypothetical protein
MADLVTLCRVVSRSKFIRNNLDETLVYLIFSIIASLGLRFLADHTFSAMLTLSAAVQCLGFALLRMKIRKQNNSVGISSRTLRLYAVMYVARLISTLQYSGYLPIDRSGDFLYQLIDVFALFLVLSLLWTIHTAHESTYEASVDTCNVVWLLSIAFVLAWFLSPDLNNSRVPDVSWTFALYVESVAMVPQLFMLSKTGGEVERLASHYIACTFIARLLMLNFWFGSYIELQPKDSEYNLPGYGVIAVQLLQVVIVGDFMWMYIRNMYMRTRMVLPTY